MDDMENFDPEMLDTLFNQYFETMGMNEADKEMTLKNFDSISYEDKNNWIEYMLKTVYGFRHSWNKAFNDFIGIWRACIVMSWEKERSYPAMVPQDESLNN